MENKLLKFITGFRKLHGIQHSTVAMLEKWRKALDKIEHYASYLWPLVQSITIFCSQNCMSMVSL